MATRWLIFIILIGRAVLTYSSLRPRERRGSSDVAESPAGRHSSTSRSNSSVLAPIGSTGVSRSSAGGLRRPSSFLGQIPDIGLMYNVTIGTSYQRAYCFNGQQDHSVDAKLVPYYSTKPTIYENEQDKFVDWIPGMPLSARGLVCSNAKYIGYRVMAPFTDPKAPLIPDRLSFTVATDEDLHLTFTTENRNKQVMWQKEPINVQAWEKATLTSDGRLIIPAYQLNGSGFYTVTPEKLAPRPTVDQSEMGTFSLIVQSCPPHRFGSDCSQWCPDCMNGGVCDDRSGACVCPPRLSGHRCQTRCAVGSGNRGCSEFWGDRRGYQVCLPGPYGCRCYPGHMGYTCNQGCRLGRWGVDCSQTCSHCFSGVCEATDGSCKGEQEPCAGGDLGLPRLRIPPQIMRDTGYTVEVAIPEWNSTFDDGQLEEGETISYILQVLVDGRQFKRMEVAPPSHTVSGLQPKTTYEVRVVIVVETQYTVCEVNGNSRERVHTKKFTTTCPDELPVPTGIVISNRTAESFLVTWQAIPYMKDCHFQYYVEVLEDKQNKLVEDTHYLVSGLRPYSNYTVTLYTYHPQAKTYSDTPDITTRAQTLPRKPGPPDVSHVQNNTYLIFKWKSSPTDQGNISHLYKYKRIYKACRHSSSTSAAWNYSEKNELQLRAAPYTTVFLQVQSFNEAGQGNTSTHTVEVPARVPSNKIEKISCFEDDYCSVTVENDCSLENGPGFRVGYLLRPHEDDILEYDPGRNESLTNDQPFLGSLFLIYLPGDMLAYTRYRLTVYPTNEEGSNRSLSKTEVFSTAPTAPGSVTHMNVYEDSTSLTVEWEDPEDYPPKGQLEVFKVAWKQMGTSRWTSKILPAVNNTYTIKHLAPNQEYTIRVRAKNFGVNQYSPFSEKIARTRKDRPSPPLDLGVVNVTQTEAVVRWRAPELTYGSIVNYTTSVQTIDPLDSEQPTSHNTTANVTRFTGLKAARQYAVRVAACNDQKCGREIEIKLWTRPTPPQPLSQVDKVNATGTSITIHLPTVQIYPVWQWILVADPQESLTKEKAKEIVEGNPQELSTTNRVWIAAILFQDESNVSNVFVVGNNETYGDHYNHLLESGKRYQLTVVTESRAGNHRELHVSKPRTFQASPPFNYGVLVPILLVLLLLILLIAAVLLWPRFHHKTILVRVRPQMNAYLSNDFEGIDTVPNGSNHVEKTVMPAGHVELKPVQNPANGHSHDGPVEAEEESDYVNVTRRVPKAEVETFLAHAIRSPETVAEFHRVPTNMGKSCSDGECQENRRKNRYRNNLPYNETRVKLTYLPDEPFSDYVNASYIQGHLRPDAYIASQGPKDSHDDTIGDFWRMIWESNTHIIIMLANLIEKGKVKVAQYWPEKSMVKGDMHITLVSTEIKMDFIIRTLNVSKDEQVRKVKQYHYTAWPDHGVPDHPFGLAKMLNLISVDYTTGPITVHCSAGIGRTGTIILVLYVLDQLNTSGYMDAHEALVTLRNGRSRLVDNTSQYIFGHQLLHEIVTGTETSCSCVTFPQKVARLRQPQPESDDSIIHQQFKKLKLLPKSFTYKYAQDPVCVNLNRDPNILPADNKMVFLQSCGDGLESQYVNIVRVNAMDRQDAYLAGEHPQSHTLGSVWRLVYERSVPVWVLLQTFPEHDPEYPELLDSKQPQEVDGLYLTVTDQVQYKNFVEYHVVITFPTSQVFASHKCVVLKMEGWPYTEPLPASSESLLTVIDKAKFYASRKGCILLTCKDGAVGCGVAVAILQVIDRIDLLQEVDIYRSVLSVVYDRPQFITSVEQYDFLHEAALEYLKNNDHYSNFV